MLEQILIHLKNWFEVGKVYDKWHIVNGVLMDKEGNQFDKLCPNQFYRITGSIFNDGLHKYTDFSDELIDETFEGSVYLLAIPSTVIKLASEIREWQDKNAAELDKPFESESFGGYSYTRGKDAQGNSVSWQSVFRTRLNPWRKV